MFGERRFVSWSDPFWLAARGHTFGLGAVLNRRDVRAFDYAASRSLRLGIVFRSARHTQRNRCFQLRLTVRKERNLVLAAVHENVQPVVLEERFEACVGIGEGCELRRRHEKEDSTVFANVN